MRAAALAVGVLVTVVLASVVLDAVPVAAQEGPQEVAVDNYLFLRIRTPAAGFTMDQRRILLDQRMVNILSYEDAGHPNVWVGNIRGKPTIYVGKTQLITVYPRDAGANKTTSEWLAAHWAERVRVGLKKVGPARSESPE